MKKFLLLAHGEMQRTPEFFEAHQKWWSAIQDRVVDSGNPLVAGRRVTSNGDVSDISPDMTPALGYSIIEAESMDDAVALMADSPMDMWVYEAMPM